MEKKNSVIGILMCIVATMSWGGMFPIMQDTLKLIDPFNFTALRYGLASIVFIVILFMVEGAKSFAINGFKLKLLLLGGLGFAGFNFLVFLGQKLAGQSGAIIASIMMGVQPLLAVVLNWIINKKKPNKMTLLYMTMALIGVVLVITKGKLNIILNGNLDITSVICILLGACCWVMYTMGTKYFDGWSPLRYTTLTSAFGCIAIVIIISVATALGLLNMPTVNTITSIYGSLLYMSLIAGVIAVLCWNGGNKAIGNINAIIFMNMVPITSFVISVINGYHLDKIEVIGSILTILALILNNISIRKNFTK